jgi:hypothetical protein
MALPKQIPFDIDNPNHGSEDDYQRCREKLYLGVTEIAQEEDLSFETLALLLVDLGIFSRMIEYVATTPKPSAGGLKLDLDRFRREIDDFVRGCKRDAEDFISSSHGMLVEAARETGKDE